MSRRDQYNLIHADAQFPAPEGLPFNTAARNRESIGAYHISKLAFKLKSASETRDTLSEK